MRAKNEFKFLAEAYDTKLILERVVDGKLMCPEACCGAPVVECTCGPDCPHCNCFMIHKAMKEKGFTNKLLKEGVEEDDPYGILDATVRDFEQELDIQGDGIDTNVNELKDYVDIIKGLDIKEVQRESALKYLMNLRGPGGRAGLEDVDFEFVFGIEDNEEPRRSITGMRQKLDALAAAQLAGSKHKPYVSSFVGDGGKKIFAVLGSNGKVVHKTHNKQEAHQWLKDNYENI